MNTKAMTLGAAISIAALTIGSGSAHADSGADHNVGYRATTTASSIGIEIDSGSLTDDNGVLKVRSDRGKVLAGTELSFRVDDFVFPIRADITGRTATLTPQLDPAHAVYRPIALPYEDQAPWKTPYDREQAAWSRLTSTIGAGATVGTLVGGLTGGAVGCLLGGIAGATVAAATLVGLFGPFVPAALVGCLGGIVAVGALGTLAGQLLVTAPVTVLAAVQYFTTINQPFQTH
ncbi:hypothetical protein [Nocardia macrotermitis]|uniref:DUF8020 domain-containing protein n=1 Tax=Nocardia macrotermitis TaxID=2585198 RepID=A0A7K0D370_9NOCA|nr:hypothetical protein [Nocardia macrotermitis]MQY20183.1 hypothetical protein [Nocardia macrotermitis]